MGAQQPPLCDFLYTPKYNARAQVVFGQSKKSLGFFQFLVPQSFVTLVWFGTDCILEKHCLDVTKAVFGDPPPLVGRRWISCHEVAVRVILVECITFCPWRPDRMLVSSVKFARLSFLTRDDIRFWVMESLGVRKLEYVMWVLKVFFFSHTKRDSLVERVGFASEASIKIWVVCLACAAVRKLGGEIWSVGWTHIRSFTMIFHFVAHTLFTKWVSINSIFYRVYIVVRGIVTLCSKRYTREVLNHRNIWHMPGHTRRWNTKIFSVFFRRSLPVCQAPRPPKDPPEGQVFRYSVECVTSKVVLTTSIFQNTPRHTNWIECVTCVWKFVNCILNLSLFWGCQYYVVFLC